MRRCKNVYIIVVFPSGNRSDSKVYKDGYKRKKDAEAFLKDMGCTYHSPSWEKENMIYDIFEIRINRKFK